MLGGMRLPGLKLNITGTYNKDGRMLAAKNNFVSSWVVGDVVTFTNASVVTRANDLHSTRATTKTMNGKFHASLELTWSTAFIVIVTMCLFCATRWRVLAEHGQQ